MFFAVSVGGDPDHLLTVWDWDRERIVLHAKAFSQDVFRVDFSPFDEGRLITSGTGHIRFWKMADTFTGLKLQARARTRTRTAPGTCTHAHTHSSRHVHARAYTRKRARARRDETGPLWMVPYAARYALRVARVV